MNNRRFDCAAKQRLEIVDDDDDDGLYVCYVDTMKKISFTFDRPTRVTRLPIGILYYYKYSIHRYKRRASPEVHDTLLMQLSSIFNGYLL